MNNLIGANILVTGGAGFIGSSLVKKLLENQANVHVIDLAILPKSIFALDSLEKKVKFEVIDVRDRDSLLNFFANTKIEYIVHLAALASVLIGQNDPAITLETNIMGTVNILEAVRKSRDVKGIIVASSDKAYGKTNQAYTEKSFLQGNDPFGVSKSSADLICQAYFKTFTIPVAITRFSNVYGEGDLHFDRIIPEMCTAIVTGKTFNVRSDGTYRRDYIYIQDAVNGYLSLLQHMDAVRGEAYNFSSEDNLSVIEVISKARKAIGNDFPYTIKNTAKNELPYQHLNNDKIKNLGWSCQYSFENIIPSVISWYRNILK